MSDIKLFRVTDGKAAELKGENGELDRPLQTQIEGNLESLLGIRLVASEYSTGKTHGGRIATLGLDENHCPVVLEYKRAVGDNVINQGLFYLDWLLDHQAEFKLLVLDVLGKPAGEAIDWNAPRLVCVAADFTRYDAHAALRINRNIELIRYRRFGPELLLLELASAFSPGIERHGHGGARKLDLSGATSSKAPADRTFADMAHALPVTLADMLASLEDWLLALGDDIQRCELRHYVAYKRIKNFASVTLQRSRLLLYLHIDPTPWVGKVASGRDVRRQGHGGTGDLELSLVTPADVEAAKPLILMAYEGRGETIALIAPAPEAAPAGPEEAKADAA